jgi:hypothetical protein
MLTCLRDRVGEYAFGSGLGASVAGARRGLLPLNGFSLSSTVALVLLLPAAVAPAPRDETTETWPDGKPKKRYTLDSTGRLQGEYLEWFENGRLSIHTTYSNGGIDGNYVSFFENGAPKVTAKYWHGKLNSAYVEKGADGKPFIEATYADGELDGKRTVRRDGVPLSLQVWKKGVLVDLMGAVPYPQALPALKAGLAAIAAETKPRIADGSAPPPEPKPKKKPGEKEKKGEKPDKPVRLNLTVPDGYAPDVDAKMPQRFAALKRLQEYRLLAGVAWQDLELVPRYDYYCDCGSRLLDKVGHLDHTPPNPGVPDSDYHDGYTGTSNSNLFSAPEMRRSVDFYMDDSDASNIGRVGHRRHCIHPDLMATGFGSSEHNSAMWSLDRSRRLAKLPATVTWPAAGFMSSRHFEVRQAWSCSFFGINESELPGASDVDVRVFPMDDNYLPAEKGLEIDFKTVDGNAVIFRPVLEGLLAGRRFWVEIHDAPGQGKTTHYLVEFVDLGG